MFMIRNEEKAATIAANQTYFSIFALFKYLPSIFLCPTGFCDVFVSLQMDEFVCFFRTFHVECCCCCDLITSQLGRVSVIHVLELLVVAVAVDVVS